MDLPLGSVGLVCASVVSVVASVVSLSVVETVLKETKLLVKQRFDETHTRHELTKRFNEHFKRFEHVGRICRSQPSYLFIGQLLLVVLEITCSSLVSFGRHFASNAWCSI